MAKVKVFLSFKFDRDAERRVNPQIEMAATSENLSQICEAFRFSC